MFTSHEASYRSDSCTYTTNLLTSSCNQYQ